MPKAEEAHHSEKHHRIFVISIFAIYMLGMTALMVWQGIGLAPDRYALILLLGALFIRRTRGFLLDWIPFLFILISYDFLRGFADNLGARVHIQELIEADLVVFGYLPTVELQKLLFNPASPAWYDYMWTVQYFLHFVLPLSFGFLLWMYDRVKFRQFVTGIVLLSYAAWITYMAYPAAPPWMAKRDGYIQEPLHKVMSTTFKAFPEKLQLPTVYHNFNPNPVAAMPSLHAAYPFLVLLFALKFFKWKGLFFLPYVLSMWFAIVYLGEHYVIDVVFGAIYALCAYLLAKEVLHRVKWRKVLGSLQKRFSLD